MKTLHCVRCGRGKQMGPCRPPPLFQTTHVSKPCGPVLPWSLYNTKLIMLEGILTWRFPGAGFAAHLCGGGVSPAVVVAAAVISSKCVVSLVTAPHHTRAHAHRPRFRPYRRGPRCRRARGRRRGRRHDPEHGATERRGARKPTGGARGWEQTGARAGGGAERDGRAPGGGGREASWSNSSNGVGPAARWG